MVVRSPFWTLKLKRKQTKCDFLEKLGLAAVKWTVITLFMNPIFSTGSLFWTVAPSRVLYILSPAVLRRCHKCEDSLWVHLSTTS